MLGVALILSQSQTLAARIFSDNLPWWIGGRSILKLISGVTCTLLAGQVAERGGYQDPELSLAALRF